MFGRATIRLGIGPHSSWLYAIHGLRNIAASSLTSEAVADPRGSLGLEEHPCASHRCMKTTSIMLSLQNIVLFSFGRRPTPLYLQNSTGSFWTLRVASVG